MRDEIEIYNKLRDLVIEYLCEYLKYGECEKVRLLRTEIKTLCWTLDRIDLYEELPKTRFKLLILQKQMRNYYENQQQK